MQIFPIAHIKTAFSEKFGIPRQSGRVCEAFGEIIFEPQFRNPDALREIEGFSHLWLIFDFSEAHTDKFSPTVRPPRLGGNRRVGVFASRSPFRPNSLGLSCVKLLGINNDPVLGKTLKVGGVDLLDGTPIYDIKPYIPYSDCVYDALGGYAEKESSHFLEVCFPKELSEKLPLEIRSAVTALIREDPRPAYQNRPDRIYKMRFSDYDISFTVNKNSALVVSVQNVK